MAATMEAAMFIMINMYGYVHANVCVHVHEYVHKSGNDSNHPKLHQPTHPHLQRGDPLKTVSIQ